MRSPSSKSVLGTNADDRLDEIFRDGLQDNEQDIDITEAMSGLGLSSLEDKLPGTNIVLLKHQVCNYLGVKTDLSGHRCPLDVAARTQTILSRRDSGR